MIGTKHSKPLHLLQQMQLTLHGRCGCARSIAATSSSGPCKVTGDYGPCGGPCFGCSGGSWRMQTLPSSAKRPSTQHASLCRLHRPRSFTQPPCAAGKVRHLLRGQHPRRLGHQPPGRAPLTLLYMCPFRLALQPLTQRS
jgi:hypothetical protein